MTYEYLNNDDDYTNRDLISINSTLITNTTNEYYATLNPGTYFIVTRLDNRNNNDYLISYTFNVSLTKSNIGYSNVSIADLRFNKNLGAVAWISDLRPGGITHSFNALHTPIYYQYNK